ncbi:MAG: DUF1080 domain-containing protein [Acidobacteriota bacterium]|nr:DUF1080 domain-containing protein [Acidobacteriota bacterium]
MVSVAMLAAGYSQEPGIPRGFKPIFNGRNLRGWHDSRTDHHGSTSEAVVADGVLSLRQSPYGQGGLLLTDKRYQNFELYLEVKAPWGFRAATARTFGASLHRTA